MQKRVLSKAIALAVATLGTGAAFAQSSVTLYGNIDVGFDHVTRKAKTFGATQPVSTTLTTLNGGKLNANRVTPDLSSQSSLGFKGTEDLGGGMKAGFVLEGQPLADTGSLSRDGRIFGRQAFVGVTTPYGEVRIGRQYAPIFFSSALVTVERFGGTDLFIEGGLTNNLHVRWDNAVTYSAQVGDFRGQLGWSPNAGSARKISGARASTPPSATTGQILGGATAGAEDGKNTGNSSGAFLAYTGGDLTLTGGLSYTSFHGATLAAGSTGAVELAKLDSYKVANVGFKYALADTGLIFNGAFGRGTYDFLNGSQVSNAPAALGGFSLAELAIPNALRISSLVLGTRYNIGAMAFLAQWSETKFRNGNHGKDTSFMLGAEYSLSKRTTLYTRLGATKDKGIGPDVLLVATGVRETPVFVGTGLNPDSRTSIMAVGVRHSF